MRSPVFLLLALLSYHSKLFACDDWAAKVVSVSGFVEVGESGAMEQAMLDTLICPGQTLMVGDNSRAAIYLSNNSFVRLDQSTVLSFPAPKDEEGFFLGLKSGIAHFISRISKRFVVDAPYVNAAVDGTEFLVSVSARENSVSVIEGKVTAENSLGSKSVSGGNQLTASGPQSSFKLSTISTAEAIDWAIYYSPLPFLAELQAKEDGEKYTQAITYVSENRIDLALKLFSSELNLDENTTVAEAALLLSIGHSEKARQLLQSSNSAQSFSLLSVIYSSRNQAALAVDAAKKAVSIDSSTVTSWLALSYAQQSSLNLPLALDAAQKATSQMADMPTSAAAKLVAAITWARLGEMQLATGDIVSAHSSIERAQTLQPKNAYVNTQMGFVQLFRLNIQEAQGLFMGAIQQDSENPQAHLGLGLTWLRAGRLEEGRQQIEYAVSLDPVRSISRSYLGRAYFEEKRDAEAQTQWQIAKQLDPHDPTPHFYEGVRLLFANDPIAAVEELETSKNLNDERALYRSETLLQSDVASRSATLARAYDDAGYDQGVLLSAWGALRNDPTSSEGHRLLADYYLGQSRFEQIRASELLQSQLWQPLSAYPLQPQLSTTGISVVEGAGPQNPSFNEYHSLFTQDGPYGLISGYGGSDNTWGNDLVGSFLAGPLAVSVGQFHYETDGWRDDADQEQDIHDALVQWQISPDTSVQLQGNKLKSVQGDVAPRFFGRVFDVEDEVLEQESYRFGLRQRLNASSWMLASVVKKMTENSTFNLQGPDEIEVVEEFSDQMFDLQLFHGWGSQSLAYGVNYLESEFLRTRDQFTEFPAFPPIFGPSFYSRSEVKESKPSYRTAYIYYTKKLDPRHWIQVGLEYSDTEYKTDEVRNSKDDLYDIFGNLDSSTETQQKVTGFTVNDTTWLPKIGLHVDFNANSELRLAAYRTLGRNSNDIVSLQPASFLGFPQAFGDNPGELGSNYAMAYDYQGFSGAKFGFSYIRRIRELEVERVFATSPTELDIEFQDFNSSEHIANGYITYLPNPAVSFSINLNWDRTLNQSRSQLVAQRLPFIDRYSIPLAITLFDRQRSQMSLEQVYFAQRIRQTTTSDLTSKSTWVTNVNFGYRFPKRAGQFQLGIKNLLGVDEEFVSHNAEILAFYPKRFIHVSLSLDI